MKSISTGAATKFLTLTILRNIEILLPSMSSQSKIASILSAYDDLIENNLKRIKILEEMAQMIYREWFVNFRFPGHEKVKMVDSTLGKIPEGWKVKKLGDMSSLIKRGISPKYDDEAQCIVINQRCIRDFKLDLSHSRRNSQKVPEDKYVIKGDVLVNSTGVETLGRVTQLLIEIPNCTADSHVTIVRPNDNISHHFFGLQVFLLQEYFERHGKGATGQTELGRDAIGNADCIYTPVELQAQFDEIGSPLRELAVQLALKNANLRKTRDLLLPKLISGELDVEELDINTDFSNGH